MAIFAEDLPGCTSCGACCFFEEPDYLRVLGVDNERLGERAAELTHSIEDRSYMRLSEGHCIALQIHPSGRFVCSVYEDRPDVCRSLVRGSGLCRSEVRTKTSRTQAALVSLGRTKSPMRD